MTIKEQLARHLQHGHGRIASGDLQRMNWRDSRQKLATPSNISRRLRELEVSGKLEVQYRKGYAFYRAKQTAQTLFD
jgi:hypothetical protein